MDSKVESLLEYLKENQKTANQIIRLCSAEQEQQPPKIQPPSNGLTFSEVLEKMTELIELNKVTLQTIDLLDKRVKRLYTYMSSEISKMSKVREQEEVPTEEGEKVDYPE